MNSAQPYVYNQPRPNSQPRSNNQPTARAPVGSKPPVVRAQAPDPPTLAMPAPESFGIRLGHKDETPLDWNQLRQQLDRLGASSFQLEKHGDGYRFACRLPSGAIEGLGASESDAVRAALTMVLK